MGQYTLNLNLTCLIKWIKNWNPNLICNRSDQLAKYPFKLLFFSGYWTYIFQVIWPICPIYYIHIPFTLPKIEKLISDRRQRILREAEKQEMERDGPPIDDCCTICHESFNIPCQANCSHWFCGFASHLLFLYLSFVCLIYYDYGYLSFFPNMRFFHKIRFFWLIWSKAWFCVWGFMYINVN